MFERAFCVCVLPRSFPSCLCGLLRRPTTLALPPPFSCWSLLPAQRKTSALLRTPTYNNNPPTRGSSDRQLRLQALPPTTPTRPNTTLVLFSRDSPSSLSIPTPYSSSPILHSTLHNHGSCPVFLVLLFGFPAFFVLSSAVVSKWRVLDRIASLGSDLPKLCCFCDCQQPANVQSQAESLTEEQVSEFKEAFSLFVR